MRHIITLSGGRDSSALACFLVKDKAIGDLPFELCFTDTQAELPELYTYLDRLEAHLGQPIVRIPGPGYEELLERSHGILPAPWRRWCTDKLKIRPFNKWLTGTEATLYIGIRSDESHRADPRFTRRKATVKRWPLVELGIDRTAVGEILRRHGLHDNPIYRVKPRSGCWCCYYQSASAWKRISQLHPDLFARAKMWEERELVANHHDPKTFTFSARFRLSQIEGQQEIPLQADDQGEFACEECLDD